MPKDRARATIQLQGKTVGRRLGAIDGVVNSGREKRTGIRVDYSDHLAHGKEARGGTNCGLEHHQISGVSTGSATAAGCAQGRSIDFADDVIINFCCEEL